MFIPKTLICLSDYTFFSTRLFQYAAFCGVCVQSGPNVKGRLENTIGGKK